MAFEDLFGNNVTTSAGNRTPEPSDFIGGDPQADGGGFDFEALFSDPNFIRGLGEAGASVSSGDPIGKSLGDFASNITRRRAVQEGARESKKGNQSFQERLLDMLGQGNLLSPIDQNDAFDGLDIDGDGNMKLRMKNTPQKQGFQRQQPLESIRRPAAGGDDLPDFSNQPGEEAFDFAGLDAEDIGMLLNAEQQFGKLDQVQMRTLLDEKARRAEAVVSSKRRREDLSQLAKDRTAKVEAKRLETTEKKNIAQTLKESRIEIDARKSALKVNADKLSANEIRLEELDIATKEQELADLKADKGGSVSEQIAQKRLEIAERGEARKIAADEIANQDFILDPETPRAQAEAQARRENAKVDGEQVFFNAIDAPWFGSNTDTMDAWQIPEDLIFNGQKVTPPMLVELAEQRGVTLQKLITALEGQ